MVRWLEIHLAMQGTQIQSLLWEDSEVIAQRVFIEIYKFIGLAYRWLAYVWEAYDQT